MVGDLGCVQCVPAVGGRLLAWAGHGAAEARHVLLLCAQLRRIEVLWSGIGHGHNGTRLCRAGLLGVSSPFVNLVCSPEVEVEEARDGAHGGARRQNFQGQRR